MFRIVLIIGFIGHWMCFVLSESPSVPTNWGPYPDSHTPAAEYGPPSTTTSYPPATEYGAPPPSTPSIEPETEYNGQIAELNAVPHQPTYVYISSKPIVQFGQLRKPTPSTNIFLPKETPPKPFHSTTLNTGEVFVNTQQSAKLQLKPQFFASTQHLPQTQEIRQFRVLDKQQQQQQQQQYVPATVYGPPSNPSVSSYPNPQPLPNSPPPSPPPPVHDTNDETPLADDDEEVDTTDPTVIAVANANGQYYILSKDNTLQRVVYRTEQTNDDTINNGFTAHLRYSLVEPIRDPIYGYDDQGHLIRIYNKK